MYFPEIRRGDVDRFVARAGMSGQRFAKSSARRPDLDVRGVSPLIRGRCSSHPPRRKCRLIPLGATVPADGFGDRHLLANAQPSGTVYVIRSSRRRSSRCIPAGPHRRRGRAVLGRTVSRCGYLRLSAAPITSNERSASSLSAALRRTRRRRRSQTRRCRGASRRTTGNHDGATMATDNERFISPPHE